MLAMFASAAWIRVDTFTENLRCVFVLYRCRWLLIQILFACYALMGAFSSERENEKNNLK